MDNQSESQQITDFQPEHSSGFKFFLSKNKSLIILIAILSAISFGITGYLLITNKKTPAVNKIILENIAPTSTTTPSSEKITSNTPQPSAAPTPTITLVNPTATWSAFSSSTYSYSIKYPPNWTAQTVTQSDPKILEYVVFNPTATRAGTLSITLSYGTRTYLEALALDPQIGETILAASVSSTKKNSKDSNGYKATNIIVPYGSNTIIFNAKDAYANLFNQMLTTLKFPK